MNKKDKIAIIIGAGPAGLTAAYQILDKTDIKPIIFEITSDIGGISKTVNNNGNRIDIGGHRFFSKSHQVMEWWKNILPLQGAPARDDRLLGRKIPLSSSSSRKALGSKKTKKYNAPDPEKSDGVMLIRNRISRILFLRKFFDYPISLNLKTLHNLGLKRTFKIGLSYIKISIKPIRDEKSLEDFFINRFGRELYQTFFENYTEKVWGVPCSEIGADWGKQRIKGLSILKTITHGIKKIFKQDSSVSQKKVETSLIEQFYYPKYGPGQLWEEVARLITENGGELHLNQRAVGIINENNKITGLTVRDENTGELITYPADYLFSTMPVKDLIASLQGVPAEVGEIAQGLIYRDFMTVGILLDQLKIKNNSKIKTLNDLIPDNWIYIQEKDVKMGRIQIFNNWSPYMVKDPDKVLIGLEYFVNEGDALWTMDDEKFKDFAVEELTKIKFADKEDILDSFVIRVPKTYPAYFGTYNRFDEIRSFTDKIENLFLIGRNGMHRYNNMDHSMLTAMEAVDNIINHVSSKDNLWAVNAEEEYHEEA
ncbi:MAG: NAD(P)/FAD-dependent oxidoreductase [Methanobacterium sp.]|nr:NAD(P)/FAD-dependent oxidoreductase [Methanobacterium sp.]